MINIHGSCGCLTVLMVYWLGTDHCCCSSKAKVAYELLHDSASANYCACNAHLVIISSILNHVAVEQKRQIT